MVNQMTIGSVETEIHEDYIEPEDINPGDVIAKTVCVENVGKSPAWVRVLAVFSPSSCEKWASFDADLTSWTLSDDGFYYYNEPLNPGERTKPLFTHVAIDSKVSKSDLCSFDLVVYHESVQSKPFENSKQAFEHIKGGAK